VITLSGSGEPTLYSRLGELIAGIKHRSCLPVAVLTNGSLLSDPEVRRDLRDADLIIPSLDAGDETLFQKVNRPHRSLTLEGVVEGITKLCREFSGDVWLEVLLLKDLTATTSQVEKISRLARIIKPARIQLGTLSRPPAEAGIRAASEEDLRRLAPLFEGTVEIIKKAATPRTGILQERDIEALIQRRPCTVREVSEGLGMNRTEVIHRLEELVRTGAAVRRRSDGWTFYESARP
jgi:wyosine [tRNA(Phe)-imidazoG37] synthetase (radical SAM superfamily)